MPEDDDKSRSSIVPELLALLLGLPWPEVIGSLWRFGRKALRGLSNEGMYEVLEYESTLEIRDEKGERATFRKRKRVCYLQDGIIAYQDYAWGDGEILLNYRTSRGKAVDRHRSGFKTYILLSLREIKNRGDVDEFNIQWNIRRGFLTEDGYWGTDISQRTRKIRVNVIFPKSRPPMRLSLEECNRKRTYPLERDAHKQLPDGRWLVTWDTDKPRLYELYVMRWTW
ncbi:MAG: hypothetical protein JW862_18325 [Anaerolineales bacterium]|nr:hypothetical protein [Anaerolineales bacterium]